MFTLVEIGGGIRAKGVVARNIADFLFALFIASPRRTIDAVDGSDFRRAASAALTTGGFFVATATGDRDICGVPENVGVAPG